MTSTELTKEIVKFLDAKKAQDITAIEIHRLTTIGDYFVVASGTSTTQVKALADEVDEQLGKMGLNPKRVEGYQTANWILLDYYDVIVHIFLDETREFYSLERLWADAPRMDLTGLLGEN